MPTEKQGGSINTEIEKRFALATEMLAELQAIGKLWKEEIDWLWANTDQEHLDQRSQLLCDFATFTENCTPGN